MIALGAFETNSIAAGARCSDDAAKAADISIIESGAVCAGKYITIFEGSAAAVRAVLSVASCSLPAELFWQELYIARVHPFLVKAISGIGHPVGESIGLYESYSVIQSIRAADEIMKRAHINIIDIRLGRGLGGKSVVVFTGDLPEVKDSCDYLENSMKPEGCISDVCLLENPHQKAIAVVENSFFIVRTGCDTDSISLNETQLAGFHCLNSGGVS
jgi:microcompartment protein CcmL/EutN